MKSLVTALTLLLASGIPKSTLAEPIRIASYNVKYLSACVNHVREESIRQTFQALNADVLALQEVRDRRALEYFFDNNDWTIILDDQSTDDQKLAFVVRKTINYRLASDNVDDADDSDFLFIHSRHFPDDRDVLRLYVNLPDLQSEIEILNHHAKSRYNGRITSEATRTAASLELINHIAQSEYPIILLGDFNDTPDDASLNTLETGEPQDLTMENQPGKFMINLAERGINEDYVSYGLNTRSINKGNRVDPTIPGSRLDNYLGYNDDYVVRKALYDQVLISPDLDQQLNYPHLKIFSDPVAVRGNDDTRASDHVPVYVDIFNSNEITRGLAIESLLPNPFGRDNNNEIITLRSNLSFEFSGDITLVDDAGSRYTTYIQIQAGDSVSVRPQDTHFSLNNTRDSISLFYGNRPIQSVYYSEVQTGEWVSFN